MYVSQVKIINLLGIDRLEFKAGRFNAFTGPNGVGKTSALESVKACLKGGHDASLLRVGADKGESVLELDDGTAIRTRVSSDKTSRDLLNDAGRIAGNATQLKALYDALSVNPVEFLTASSDRRASIILEAMPLKVDPKRIQEITGQKVSEDCSAHALEVIKSVHKRIYDERTLTNGAKKQAEVGKARTISTMPVVGNINLDEDQLLTEKARIEKEKSDANSALQARIDKVVQKTELEINGFRSDIDELKAKIQELEQSFSAKKLFISEQKGKANLAIQTQSSVYDADIQKINAQLNEIKNNQENTIRLKDAKKSLEDADKEIKTLADTAEKQTKILADLESYKLELLKTLPMEGLEVIDGQVFFNSVPFDRINTAQKIKIAVEIAKLRAGELPIVCVDGMECLDQDTFELFKEEMIKSGCQCFVTRVGGEEFKVEVNS